MTSRVINMRARLNRINQAVQRPPFLLQLVNVMSYYSSSLKCTAECIKPHNKLQSHVLSFGKRQDTTDTTDFCPRQLVFTDLLRGSYSGKLV